MGYETEIKGLCHAAFRCRDSEETRKFYEDILGMRLAAAVELGQTKTGRAVRGLHSFFEMADGSYIAFFEVPEGQDESMFESRHDFDLHLAVQVGSRDKLMEYKDRLVAAGYAARGPSDHGFEHSVYVQDPNGYVVELASRADNFDEIMGGLLEKSRETLESWQQTKPAPTPAPQAE